MADGERPQITITEDGPYVVKGGPVLTRRAPGKTPEGEPLDWDGVGDPDADYDVSGDYFLCRCGQSDNKPFCDGSHRQASFDGEVTADRGPSAERRKTMVGTGVVMTDDAGLCSAGDFCGVRYTNVWKMIKKTDDPEVRARLKRMVENCPSGRLQFSEEEGGEAIEPEYAPSIAAVPDGPLWVRGMIAVTAPDGETYEVRNRVTLCRCGASMNKPFCDGSHKRTGFSTA